MNRKLSTRSESRIDLSDELFQLLTDVLNRVHDRELSERFYRIFLEDHIRSTINHKNTLDSKDLDYIRPHTFSLNYTFRPFRQRIRDFFVHIAKFIIATRNKKKREEIFQNCSDITFGFSNMEKPVSDTQCRELPDYYPIPAGGGERTKRKKLDAIAKKYETCFKRNVLQLIPKIAVEFFDQLYDKININDPANKKFHSIELRLSIFDSLCVAKYVEHGSKLYWYQDGTEPAELETKYSRWYQYSVSDEYRTWGWKMLEKDRPWKAYPLIKFGTDYQSYYNENGHDILICFPRIDDGNRNLHSSYTSKLLNRLSDDKFNSILARPYPVSNENSGQLNFIKDSRVVISSAITPIAQEISKSRIVIQMEIPSTNFAECLYVNHPSLGLLQNEHPTDIIKPYYEYFLKNGVFHKEATSLADFLNSTNLEDWWNSLLESDMMRKYRLNMLRG